MAVIPRYVSDTPVTPAINQVKMDPSVAAAPYQAAAQSTAQLTNLFQNEMEAWGKAIAIKDAEQQRQMQKQQQIHEGLYKAQAMADLRVQAEKTYQESLLRSEGSPEFPNQFDQQFQQLADQAIMNAPTPQAQIDLTKQLIGMRAQYNIKATKDATQLGNQMNMDRLEGVLDNFLGLAAANPDSIDDLKKQSVEVAKSMRALGLPQTAVLKVIENFDKKLERQAIKAQIQQDPLAAKEKLESGAFAHLGAGYAEEFKNLIDTTVSAQKTQLNQMLDGVEKRLMSGQPIPSDFENVQALATKYGMNDRAQELTRLLEVDRFAAGASATDLRTALQELKVSAASGQLNADPAQVKKLENFISGNLEALEKDPLAYAEIKGGFDPIPVLTDFSKLNPKDIEDRKFRALQVGSKYGINSYALRDVDIANAVSQLSSADPATKTQIISNLAQFDNDTVHKVSDRLSKEDPALAAALKMSSINPDIAGKVIKGQELIKAKQFKAPADEDVKNAVQDVFGDMFLENPELRQQIGKAAVSISAYEESRGNSLSLSEAASQVMNVQKVGNWSFKTNYHLVMPAKDLSEKDFYRRVDSVLADPDAWSKFANGQPVNSIDGSPIRFSRLSPSDFQYIYDGAGRYYVTYEGSPVLNKAGQEIKIDLVSMFK